MGLVRRVSFAADRGVVENMSGYAIEGMVEGGNEGQTVRLAVGTGDLSLKLDAEGRFRTVIDVFGSGGAEALAQKNGFPVLGQVPLNPAVRVGGDGGDPITLTDPDSVIAREFREVAGKFAQKIAIREHKSLPVLQ